MRKIINGKMYNTETATMVAERESGFVSDFAHFTESLYLKKTNEFFLHGEGGPASRYCEHAMGGYVGGESIIPLTVDEAKEFVEKYAEVETYIDLFGEVEE